MNTYLIAPDRLRKNGLCQCGKRVPTVGDQWVVVNLSGQRLCTRCLKREPDAAALLPAMEKLNTAPPGDAYFAIGVDVADLLKNVTSCGHSECWGPLVIRKFQPASLPWKSGDGRIGSWCWKHIETRLPAPLLDLLCELNKCSREPVAPTPAPPKPTEAEIREKTRESHRLLVFQAIEGSDPNRTKLDWHARTERMLNVIDQIVEARIQEALEAREGRVRA